MRLIEANRLFDAVRRIKGQFIEGVGEVVNTIDVLEQIKDAQTIDAVEVVRCRDCKHVQTINCPFFKAKWGYTDDDYCSCGERREDDKA